VDRQRARVEVSSLTRTRWCCVAPTQSDCGPRQLTGRPATTTTRVQQRKVPPGEPCRGCWVLDLVHNAGGDVGFGDVQETHGPVSSFLLILLQPFSFLLSHHFRPLHFTSHPMSLLRSGWARLARCYPACASAQSFLTFPAHARPILFLQTQGVYSRGLRIISTRTRHKIGVRCASSLSGHTDVPRTTTDRLEKLRALMKKPEYNVTAL